MRKRLVFRADDIGYTESFDLGAFKAIDEGYATSADVMLDSPHTVEALKMLKERPWISIGWHRHLWESPLLGKDDIPHMVDDEGRFVWRHRKSYLMNEVPYEEAFKEFKAEVERCIAVYGKAPDTAANVNTGREKNELEKAYVDVLDLFGIAHSYDREGPAVSRDLVDPKYRHVDYCQVGFFNLSNKPKTDEEKVRNNLNRFDLAKFRDYHPIENLKRVVWENDDQIWRIGGHPGYLDDHILLESTCSVHRVKDCIDCCSQEAKDYIIANKIELVNQRDAIYGTSEYQDHLKEINSPLWIGNM
ncbi:MAG: ChbG/HpnK family deacetylase [Erysipelotrichaceae bacterium]|nr:ChbG/HpnK family deacetylase [Erysipelotrichaceae bacterium]